LRIGRSPTPDSLPIKVCKPASRCQHYRTFEPIYALSSRIPPQARNRRTACLSASREASSIPRWRSIRRVALADGPGQTVDESVGFIGWAT